MKIKLRNIVLIIFLALLGFNAFAQVPQIEKDALIALYNSTNGASWTKKNGWDIANPSSVVTTWNATTQTGWYGVTVTNGRVTKLTLDTNNLNGTIPSQLGNLTMLTTLTFITNNLSGVIPQEIGNLINLTGLSFAGNKLTGSIPNTLGNLTKLVNLRLEVNQLSGIIPTELGGLVNVTHFELRNNLLTGTIPLSLGNLTKLVSLRLEVNQLSGTIPLIFSNLPNLTVLYLHSNQLTGEIPSQIGNLLTLKNLTLSVNKLTGTIPVELGNLRNLAYLELQTNLLTGAIPKQLGNLTNLSYMNIANNLFSGTIPSELGQLAKLETLYLNTNQLSGQVPVSFQSLSKLKIFVLYGNQLSGPIPNLTGLVFRKNFSLYSNKFRFVDFANEYQSYRTNFTTFNYSPQAKTDTAETISKNAGSSVTFTMCTDNRYTGNDTFQWYKNGSIITGATSRQYTIPNLTAAHAGSYYCISKNPQITNTLVTLQNLSLQRESIQLAVYNATSLNACPEGFEGATFQPTGWVVFQNGFGTNIWASNTTFPHLGTKAAQINSRQNIGQGNTSKDFLATPLVTIPANGQLRFWSRTHVNGNQGTKYQIRIASGALPANQTDETAYTTLVQEWTEDQLSTTYNIYEEKMVNFPQALWNTQVYIAFVDEYKQPTTALSGDTWFLDDIRIVERCADPAGLTVSAILPTSVNLSWANSGADSWEVEIFTSPVSGPPVSLGIVTTSTNSYLATGLTSGTSYNFFVRAICRSCDTNNSPWVQGYHFIPRCLQPVNLVSSNYNGTSANLSWTESGAATSWEVAVRPYGLSSAAPVSTGIVNVSSYSVSGLAPDIIYEFKVRAICGPGSTSAWAPLQGTIGNLSVDCPKSSSTYPVVKQLFVNLINDILTVVNTTETLPSTYSSAHLRALAPYISDYISYADPRLFNFSYANNTIGFSFANHPGATRKDVVIENYSSGMGLVTDFYPSYYYNSDYFSLNGNITFQNNNPAATISTKHIDFCPTILASCTATNPNSAVVKGLFINLVNKLRTLSPATVTNGYTCLELVALAPYLTDANPGIYNINYYYLGNGTLAGLFFSFSNHGADYDVEVPLQGGLVNVDLSQFQSSGVKASFNATYANGTTNPKGYFKHIDFCPDELHCVSHVAIVVDESGSIDDTEKRKIKKQLKSFVRRQAEINDTQGTNIHISLIGMSDNDDANSRTDHVLDLKVTGSNINQLNGINAWIDGYGSRYGSPGISPSSDYWDSGLSKALTLNPDIVIMITDGCETASATHLKTTMKSFRNYTNSPNAKTHLYVVGIENGFYVDDDNAPLGKSMARNQDPNYVPSLQRSSQTERVTSYLRKSLQYLLDYPTSPINVFPEVSIDHFASADYFGHSDFSLLGFEENYFSNNLVNEGIICGADIPKDVCDDCFSFQPEPGKQYMLSAWAKEETNVQVKTYENPKITLRFYSDKEAEHEIIPSTPASFPSSGDIIDGWQRIVATFIIPQNTVALKIQLENASNSIPVYFDDIRIHPLEGSMKSFIYDPETFKLMSELDENNYSTFYEYDNEGGLVRVKKETAKGIKTIQETRSGSVIIPNED